MAKERVEVFCAGKVAVLDDFRRLEMVDAGKRREERGAQDKGWKDEWVSLAKAIQQGGEPPIPYDQLIGVAKATFAAVESIRTRGMVEI